MARGRYVQSNGCPNWCDWAEQGPHDGLHVHHMGEVLLSRQDAAYVVSVTVESTGDDPLPCLTVGGKYTSYATAAMTWAESDRLARLLHEARQRYG